MDAPSEWGFHQNIEHKSPRANRLKTMLPARNPVSERNRVCEGCKSPENYAVSIIMGRQRNVDAGQRRRSQASTRKPMSRALLLMLVLLKWPPSSRKSWPTE